MKKLITIFILLISIHSFSQDVVGSRVIAKQAFFLKDTWVDSLKKGILGWQNNFRTVPTSGAVYDFVMANGGGSGGGNPCKAQDLVFRINDYGFPLTGETTYKRSIFDGAHIDIWRMGEKINESDATFGYTLTDSTITFVPMFTGNETMLIRIQPDSCFESITQRPVLIILNGESLMTGWGKNDSSTATENATRRMKNLNGLTQAFALEKLGANSSDATMNNYLGINLGGNTAFSRTHHGLELGFANKYDSGYFDGRSVYVTKCALGGTRILDWRRTAATHYYDTLTTYVHNSINAIVAATGMMPIVFFEWECAVNDQVAGMSASAWQDTVSRFFSDVRSHFNTNFGVDTTYISMFKMTSPSNFSAFNTNMDNLQIADANGTTFSISTAGATYTCEDISCHTHWGYTGMRNVVVQNAMVKILQILARY